MYFPNTYNTKKISDDKIIILCLVKEMLPSKDLK